MNMRVGVQRRKVRVMPTTPADLDWLLECCDRPELAAAFGLEPPASAHVRRTLTRGGIAGMIFRAEARVGFVLVFPPTDQLTFWELAYAIPDTAHRDGVTAIHAADAMIHYLFEVAAVETVGWRTREDNEASEAVIRLAGYAPFGRWEVDGVPFVFYAIDAAVWSARKARLEAQEHAQPTPGGLFRWVPVPEAASPGPQ